MKKLHYTFYMAVALVGLFISAHVVFGDTGPAAGPSIPAAVPGGPASGGGLSSTDLTQGSPLSFQFLQILSQIRGITIDNRVFNSPIFQSLKDFSLQVTAEPLTRRNPFAPIGVESGTVGAASSIGARAGASAGSGASAKSKNNNSAGAAGAAGAAGIINADQSI